MDQREALVLFPEKRELLHKAWKMYELNNCGHNCLFLCLLYCQLMKPLCSETIYFRIFMLRRSHRGSCLHYAMFVSFLNWTLLELYIFFFYCTFLKLLQFEMEGTCWSLATPLEWSMIFWSVSISTLTLPDSPTSSSTSFHPWQTALSSFPRSSLNGRWQRLLFISPRDSRLWLVTSFFNMFLRNGENHSGLGRRYSGLFWGVCVKWSLSLLGFCLNILHPNVWAHLFQRL